MHSLRRAPRLRAALPLLALVLGATPAMEHGASAASAGLVTLSYRFAPGEIMTYSIVFKSSESKVVDGRTVDTGTETATFQSRIVVHAVSPTGDAVLSATNGPAHVVSMLNGRVTRKTVAGDRLTTPTDACYADVFGTEYCAYRGAFGQNDVGQVAADPVPVGASWNTRIDNTWAIDGHAPVTLRNTLRSVTAGIATIETTGHPHGAMGASQGSTIIGALDGHINGVWSFDVARGLFTDEQLTETAIMSGTIHTAHGARPATGREVTVSTMRLLSVGMGTPNPLHASGALTTYENRAQAVHFAYPARWLGHTAGDGSFTALSRDGNTAVIVGRLPGIASARASDVVFLRTMIYHFGTPVDPLVVATKMSHGEPFGRVSTIIRSSDGSELLCDIATQATPHGVYVLVGLAALGKPNWALRLPHAAWSVEAMWHAMASASVG